MKSKDYLILLYITLIISSCSSTDIIYNKHSIINIADNIGKGHLANLSEIAESIEYIPLETNDSTLLGTIIRVYYSSGYFLPRTAKNTSGVYIIFDKDGQHHGKLNSKGRGPG